MKIRPVLSMLIIYAPVSCDPQLVVKAASPDVLLKAITEDAWDFPMEPDPKLAGRVTGHCAVPHMSLSKGAVAMMDLATWQCFRFDYSVAVVEDGGRVLTGHELDDGAARRLLLSVMPSMLKTAMEDPDMPLLHTWIEPPKIKIQFDA